MRISELIEHLQRIQEESGDLEVTCPDGDREDPCYGHLGERCFDTVSSIGYSKDYAGNRVVSLDSL